MRSPCNVIPAKAGIHANLCLGNVCRLIQPSPSVRAKRLAWIPAFAGMTPVYGMGCIPVWLRRDPSMKSFLIFAVTALAEIAGCFAFWAWARHGASAWWLGPGMASLALFAWLLTQVESEAAGRAFAAYGGVYIAASLLWLWGVEGVRPDRWDALGAAVCLVGAGVILLGPRPA